MSEKNSTASADNACIYITDYGAVGDNNTLNTDSIQDAIDRMANKGGGTVVVSCGTFMSGALFMKPGVNLHLEDGAVIKCSADIDNFPPQRTRIEGHFEDNFNPALINAEGCDGFCLTGRGTLDGVGMPIWELFWKNYNEAEDKANFRNLSIPRARLCLISNSNNVLVKDVTFKDSQFWNLHIYKCQNMAIDGAKFVVPDDYRQAPSSDGIDVDSCQDITIKNCYFSVTDDCIALKGTKGPFALEDKDSPPVERIHVSDCVFKRGHHAVTCGSEATIVKDVTVENCQILNVFILLYFKLRPDTPQNYSKITASGIKSDGGCSLIGIAPWTQYFDLKGQPEPFSRVGEIKLSDIDGKIGSLGFINGNANTEFGQFLFENIDVEPQENKFEISEKAGDVTLANVKVNGELMLLSGVPQA